MELDGGIHSRPSRVWKDAAKEDYWRAGGPGSSRRPQFLFTQPKVVSQFVQQRRRDLRRTSASLSQRASMFRW